MKKFIKFKVHGLHGVGEASEDGFQVARRCLVGTRHSIKGNESTNVMNLADLEVQLLQKREGNKEDSKIRNTSFFLLILLLFT